MRQQLCALFEQHTIFPNNNGNRILKGPLAVPAGMCYASGHLAFIKEYFCTTAGTRDDSSHKVCEGVQPLLFGDALVWRCQPLREGLREQIPNNLRVDVPINQHIVLISFHRAVGLIIGVKDKNRIRTIKAVHGMNVHTTNVRLQLSFQWMPHHEHIEQ